MKVLIKLRFFLETIYDFLNKVSNKLSQNIINCFAILFHKYDQNFDKNIILKLFLLYL